MSNKVFNFLKFSFHLNQLNIKVFKMNLNKILNLGCLLNIYIYIIKIITKNTIYAIKMIFIIIAGINNYIYEHWDSVITFYKQI
jgi:hypothetical protein